jgi:tetratricopeptide (TPR) repeat protein
VRDERRLPLLTICGRASDRSIDGLQWRHVVFWLGLLVGATAALADAKQDCAKLSGDAAIAACDQAIRQNPKDAESYSSRGGEYMAKRELDRAIADYNKAIELDPKYPSPTTTAVSPTGTSTITTGRSTTSTRR